MPVPDIGPPLVDEQLTALIKRLAFLKPGLILPFSHTAAQLDPLWYICNDERWPEGSPQGQVLLSFDADFRAAWEIELDGEGLVNVPNLIDYFPRAVDGSARQVGSIQADALQNIVGDATYIHASAAKSDVFTGALRKFATTPDRVWNISINGGYDAIGFDFDASRVARTADETRSKNRGFIFAIYLGV